MDVLTIKDVSDKKEMDILDTLTGAELFAASNRRDEAIDQEFMAHVERVKIALASINRHEEPCYRFHYEDDELVTGSWTYLLYDNNLIPVLIGSVVREHNHRLLSIVDRSSSTPVVYERKFDTRDFVPQEPSAINWQDYCSRLGDFARAQLCLGTIQDSDTVLAAENVNLIHDGRLVSIEQLVADLAQQEWYRMSYRDWCWNFSDRVRDLARQLAPLHQQALLLAAKDTLDCAKKGRRDLYGDSDENDEHGISLIDGVSKKDEPVESDLSLSA